MRIAADFRLQVTSWNLLNSHLTRRGLAAGRHAAYAIEALVVEAAAVSANVRFDDTAIRVYPMIDDPSIVKVRVLGEVTDLVDLIAEREGRPATLAHALVNHLLKKIGNLDAIGIGLLDVRPKRFSGVIGVAEEKAILESSQKSEMTTAVA